MAVHTLLADLTFALRMMRKTPGLSAVAVLCLAIAIGLTTAAFTVVHGAFLSLLPLMLCVDVGACLGPARRALAIDPADTMRQE